MKKVVCIGGAVADVLVRPVEKLPRPGFFEHVDNITLHTGGNVSNVGINMMKLGFESVICAKIGNDNFGRFIKSEWGRLGANTDYAIMADDYGTIVSVVCIDPSGQRGFFNNGGVGKGLSMDEVDPKILDGADILFFASNFGKAPLLGADIVPMLKEARSRGIITCLDVIWSDVDNWIDNVSPAFPYLDYFLPNNDEAETLTGLTDMYAAADQFAKMGVKNVVIKMGDQGSILRKEDGTYVKTPIFKVDAVDSTGAGDAFCSGFMAGLLMEWPLEECCKLGSAVGACCVEKIGTNPGVRTMAQTLAFIKEHENQ